MQHSTRAIPNRAGAIRLGLLAVVALLATSCTTAPEGPPFVVASAPPEHRARLYVYRADVRHSLSQVRVTLDGREVGIFQNGEYETLEVSAGTHHLRAGMRSIAFVAWGWNEQRIRLTPGETVFIQLSVGLTERASPGGRELEIAGRPSGAASENVFIRQRPEHEALAAIATTTRLTP